jgi:hypothetical protein
MTNDLQLLRQQAWDTVSADTLMDELRCGRYRLSTVDEVRLTVDPAPKGERLVYLIKKHKPAILERLKRERWADPWDQDKASQIRRRWRRPRG